MSYKFISTGIGQFYCGVQIATTGGVSTGKNGTPRDVRHWSGAYTKLILVGRY